LKINPVLSQFSPKTNPAQQKNRLKSKESKKCIKRKFFKIHLPNASEKRDRSPYNWQKSLDAFQKRENHLSATLSYFWRIKKSTKF